MPPWLKGNHRGVGHLADEPAKRATFTSKQQLGVERGGLGQQGALKYKRKGKVLLESLPSWLFLFPKYVRWHFASWALSVGQDLPSWLPLPARVPCLRRHGRLFSLNFCLPVTTELCHTFLLL